MTRDDGDEEDDEDEKCAAKGANRKECAADKGAAEELPQRGGDPTTDASMPDMDPLLIMPSLLTLPNPKSTFMFTFTFT